jgi:GNAT superfamily N-acetyltransferase
MIFLSEYYDCRFTVFRALLGFKRGAELLSDDNQAIHAWASHDHLVIVVGRVYLILNNSDGAGLDHGGPDAVKIPGFGPLSRPSNRPAFQIRQMGTLENYRRQGLAAKVLASLEEAAKVHLSAKAGFLQAREHAIGFYQSQGWKIIDEPYSIEGIGPHRSMMKKF